MQLTLGPIQYFWPREQVFAFYRQAGQWPVDRIYLGETVCSKRRELRLEDWLVIAEALQDQGKEVLLSSLTLIEARSEAGALKSLCDSGLRIEANDYSAVAVAESRGLPFVGGSSLNLYNLPALDQLQQAGMVAWVPPLEMSQSHLAQILSESPGLATELFAFGRMPLAWSARCFAARAHDRPKDDCGFVCRESPDGLELQTREDTDFLVINGIQTQSHHCLDLAPWLDRIQNMGVSAVRLSPQSRNMAEIVQHWHTAIQRNQPVPTPRDWLAGPPADGYWHGEAGMLALES